MSGDHPRGGPACTVTPAGCLIWLGLLLATALVASWVISIVAGALR